MTGLRHALFRTLAALALALLLAAGPAMACPVCVDLPARTTADHLLGDPIVVLARPDPADPFRFSVDEVLRGHPDDLADTQAIPFLVDATLRRAMARDPDLRLLLSYGPPLDRNGLPPDAMVWHRHIPVSPERRTVLDAILSEGEMWDWEMTLDPARIGFFAARHADPDPAIQRLALTEIARAPYALIREIDVALPVTELEQRLTRVSDLPLAPLLILFLGISDHDAAHQLVRDGFVRALDVGGSHPAAWLVAGIEVDGPAAIDRLAARLDAPMTPVQGEDIMTALAVSGTAQPGLRDAITPLLARAVQRDPLLAATAAYTVYDWQAWSVVPVFEALLESPEAIDHATRYILDITVARARDARE